MAGKKSFTMQRVVRLVVVVAMCLSTAVHGDDRSAGSMDGVSCAIDNGLIDTSSCTDSIAQALPPDEKKGKKYKTCTSPSPRLRCAFLTAVV